MKIGILTFHRALNYGAVLQCFALYKTLENMGHEVEVIDYRTEGIERFRKTFSMMNFTRAKGITNKLKYSILSFLLYKSKKRTAKKFDLFVANTMSLSNVVKKKNDISNCYDVIFFGSDQIWNPDILNGLDPVYYAQINKGNTKFITYAASVGKIGFIDNNDNIKLFKKYVDAYDHISVREPSLKSFLSDKLQIKSGVVCDPSLLLPKEEYEKIAEEPAENNYVLLFDQFKTSYAYLLANNIAKQLGVKVITIGAETSPLHKSPCKRISEVSPSQFLGYIKKAKCIVTVSFHVTSFSVIMEKDFYTFPKNKNDDRSRTILKVAGLEHRMVEAPNVQFTSINYSNVKDKLGNYKEESLKFISNSLKIK